MRFVAMLAVATSMLTAPALAQSPPAEGDRLAGREVARTWCANGHVVEPNPARAADAGAPTFHAIAARPATTADGLRAFLATQHGRMPNLSLSNPDIGNVVAYLLSLKGN